MSAAGRRASGLGGLLRLDLRLDRRQLGVWAIALGGLTGVVASAFERLYPTLASRGQLRRLAADPTLRALVGPLVDWRTTGGLVVWREGVALAVGLALATTFLVVRRTRAEEQHGRGELLRSLPIAAAAPAIGALATAAALDAAGGGACALALLADRQGVGSSLLLGAVLALVAWSFGAIAALLAQVAGTSRGANGAAAGVVAAAYLLGALGNLAAGWVVWLSPLGWVQESSPFGAPKPQVLALPLLLGLAVAAAAVGLSGRRDVGVGLRRARAHRSRPVGRRVLGLAWRLERTTIAITIASATAYGIVAGSLVARFPHLLSSSPAFERMVERLGGTRVLTDAFTTYLVQMGAVALGAWAASLVLRLHTEEVRGRVALLTAAGASRRQVLVGLSGTAVAAGVGGTLLWGLGLGLGRTIGDHHLSSMGAGAAAAAMSIPPMLVLVGVAIAMVGLSGRWSWLAWLGVGWSGAVGILRTYLGLPGWVLGASPFWHEPPIPLHGSWWVPTLALLGIAAALGAVGVVAYERRELGGT